MHLCIINRNEVIEFKQLMTMKKLLTQLIKPIVLPHWWQDLMLTIPRIVCGFLLASDFGAAKFGLPWSPPDNNLGFFEVAFWFPKDVSNYGGIFGIFPSFLLGWAHSVKPLAAFFGYWDYKQGYFHS